jgi:hypothetical protein
MKHRRCLLVAALTITGAFHGKAQGQPLPKPVAYRSILQADLMMNVWQGRHVSFLTPTTMIGLGKMTMAALISRVDLAFDYYHHAIGSDPDPYPPCYYINGRGTIAVVEDTGGAGYSFSGATGIELQTASFITLYNGVDQKRQYDQVAFYELGRNFWVFGSQLEYGSNCSDCTGESFATGFAVFMRFKSMEYANVDGAPYKGARFLRFKQNVVNLIDVYMADRSQNFGNTLAVGHGVPGSNLGSTDLFASFLFRLGRDYGGDAFFLKIWKRVHEQPAATTEQGAIDNFFLACCYTTGRDLRGLFVDQWRWRISPEALSEACTIHARRPR